MSDVGLFGFVFVFVVFCPSQGRPGRFGVALRGARLPRVADPGWRTGMCVLGFLPAACGSGCVLVPARASEVPLPALVCLMLPLSASGCF